MCIVLMSVLQGCLGKKERIICKSPLGISFKTEVTARPYSIIQSIAGEPHFSIEAFLEIHDSTLAGEFHELLNASNAAFFDTPPRSELTSLNYAMMKDGIPFSRLIQKPDFDRVWKVYTDKANDLCENRLKKIDTYSDLYSFYTDYNKLRGPAAIYFEMFIASKFMKVSEFIEKYEQVFIEIENYDRKENENIIKDSVIDFDQGLLIAPDRAVYESIVNQLRKP